MRFIILVVILLFPNKWHWPVSLAKDQGLNPKLMEGAVKKMNDLNESYSLLILRNGYMVRENYFHGASSNKPHHIRSATKTIMSILIGIAIDKKFISNSNQQISHYFPELSDKNITIQHLLDMRSGLRWNEHQGDLLSWQNSGNPNAYLFLKPLDHAPGEHYQYNSAAVHLLGHIIEKTSGISAYDFAKKHLFQPLQIEHTKWMKLGDKMVNGGYGLEIKPSDLAKIGYLFINNGMWQDKQIISENWISKSFSNANSFNKPFGKLDNSGYGNLWWNGFYKDQQVFFALGYGGQFLIVIPDLDIIMVATQQWGYASNSLEREDFVTELMTIVIEAAIQNK